jgi:flagellar protein FliS
MSLRAAKFYANNDVETGVSSFEPGQLIVLIYERIFDHLKLGIRALESGELGIEPFTKAHDLIQQGLLACLDYQNGGEVSQSLGAIYDWALREILSGRLEKSPEKIKSVLDVLTPLYEAWLSMAPKESLKSLGGLQSTADKMASINL